MSSILFTDVLIFDGSGERPYPGEILVQGERIVEVSRKSGEINRDSHQVINGGGAVAMSGLCDSHTHITWNNGASLEATTALPPEDHMLLTIENAKLYLDCGFTMCVGAASAKPRLDVVIRDAINQGRVPGPRMLASGMEVATTGADVNPSLTADGVEEMRKLVRQVCREGVDTIKLSMSGEQITGKAFNHETFFTDEEVAVAVQEATRRGVRVSAHARNSESIRLCLAHGVNIIYHASFISEEMLDKLEEAKDRVYVAPGLAWLVQTVYNASDWGVTQEAAERMGYVRELECAIDSMKALHKRGVRVLPGGDYGFAWTPHGTYANDFEYFVDLLGFSPMETMIAATTLGGDIMGRPDDLGRIKTGYMADVLLIDGDPTKDVTILQDRDRILAILKGGQFHKKLSSSSKQQQRTA